MTKTPLRPIKTDSDMYAQLVLDHGHSDSFRYYPVAGGNHIEPLFDAHFGVDLYGTTVLRPMPPMCARSDRRDGGLGRERHPAAVQPHHPPPARRDRQATG